MAPGAVRRPSGTARRKDRVGPRSTEEQGCWTEYVDARLPCNVRHVTPGDGAGPS